MEKALEILKELLESVPYEVQYNKLWEERLINAISELEETMKPKTCNTCKKVKSCLFHKVATDAMPTMNEVNAFLICFGCIDHEPKDNT